MSYQGRITLPVEYGTVDSVTGLLLDLGLTPCKTKKENPNMRAFARKDDEVTWLVNVHIDNDNTVTGIGLLNKTYPSFYEFISECIEGVVFVPAKGTEVGNARTLDEVRASFRQS